MTASSQPPQRRPWAAPDGGTIEPLRHLDDIQAGILADFGRDQVALVLLRNGAVNWAAARAAVGGVAARVASAADVPKRQGPIVSLVLSGRGYDALRVRVDQRPLDTPFRRGMATRRALLADRDPSKWDNRLAPGLDGMVLVWADSSEELDAEVAAIRAIVGDAWRITEQRGRRLYADVPGGAAGSAERHPIEPFGFRDGISVPHFFPRQSSGGRKPDDPALVVVRNTSSFGSYVVFRKLRQKVDEFRAACERLAGFHGLDADEIDLRIVGRTKAGALRDGTDHPDFRADPQGRFWPLSAHIRRMNPGNAGLDPSGILRIVRRGTPYEEDGEVGLLFLAYMASIRGQYEVLQERYANGGSSGGNDRDPVAGQGGRGNQTWRIPNRDHPADPSKDDVVVPDLAGFVELRGGEYFFAPPIGFLHALASGDADRPWQKGWAITDESPLFDPISEMDYARRRNAVPTGS